MKTGIQFSIFAKSLKKNLCGYKYNNGSYKQLRSQETLAPFLYDNGDENTTVHAKEQRFIAILNENGTYTIASWQNDDFVLAVEQISKRSYYRPVKFVQRVSIDQPKNQQWCLSEDRLINLEAGDLTCTGNNHKYDRELYCKKYTRDDNQKWEIRYGCSPEFVFVPRGKDSANEEIKDDECPNFVRLNANNNTLCKLFWCTKNKKTYFVETYNNQLLQFSKRNEKIIANFGYIKLDKYEDFFVTVSDPSNEEMRVLRKNLSYCRNTDITSLKSINKELPLFISKNKYVDFIHGIIGNKHMEIPFGYERLQ